MSTQQASRIVAHASVVFVDGVPTLRLANGIRSVERFPGEPGGWFVLQVDPSVAGNISPSDSSVTGAAEHLEGEGGGPPLDITSLSGALQTNPDGTFAILVGLWSWDNSVVSDRPFCVSVARKN